MICCDTCQKDFSARWGIWNHFCFCNRVHDDLFLSAACKEGVRRDLVFNSWNTLLTSSTALIHLSGPMWHPSLLLSEHHSAGKIPSFNHSSLKQHVAKGKKSAVMKFRSLTTTRSSFRTPSPCHESLTAALTSIFNSPSFMGIMTNGTARVVEAPILTCCEYEPRFQAELHVWGCSISSTRTWGRQRIVVKKAFRTLDSSISLIDLQWLGPQCSCAELPLFLSALPPRQNKEVWGRWKTV